MTQPGEENTNVFLGNLHTMHCNDGVLNHTVLGNDVPKDTLKSIEPLGSFFFRC